jgi:Protein of unknown function (DUF3175)
MATKKQPHRAAAKGGRKWSAEVTKHSNALYLDKGVFTSDDPDKIAGSLDRSARKSNRKKGSSYQSAMSMLNFYINRAGKNLPAKKKKTLTKAKNKLKELHAKNSPERPAKER